MKAAMIFPGQGSQYVGMGKDMVERFPRAKELYGEADEVLGCPFSRLCFGGDPEVLRETRNAQPAILLHSVAVARILREEAGIVPAVAAGHSLGEYTALAVAGVLDAMDALRIVRKRGELMFDAGLREPGTMAAVMGLELPEITTICEEVSGRGRIVVVANINSPDQVVVSGHIEAVEEAMRLLGEHGAKKVVRLNVSGAFHSPLVASAQNELVEYLKSFPFEDAVVGVVCNVDAAVIHSRAEIIDALSRQLTSPVRWAGSMRVLLDRWDGRILEVGPGRVLAGLMRRIDRAREVQTVGTAQEIERTVAAEVELA